jgi:hypothetical protein
VLLVAAQQQNKDKAEEELQGGHARSRHSMHAVIELGWLERSKAVLYVQGEGQIPGCW